MWIFLGIILLLILLITIVLLLPFSLIIKTDKNGEPIFLFKFLFKTFGNEKTEKESPFVKALMDLSGISRLGSDKSKETSEKSGFLNLLRGNISLIMKVLTEILKVLKKCTVKVLKIDIVCAGENAADTAISYGVCYSILSPLLNLIHSNMKVVESGEKININADFNSKEGSLKVELVLVLKVYNLLFAFFNLVKAEFKRIYSKKKK